MLEELAIKNFAIISDLKLSFKQGMTALTGETGAGKSIIIDAVGLLAGARASSDFIRNGTEKAVLEGQFSIEAEQKVPLKEKLNELGIEMEDNELIISRTLTSTGKNICRVNNTLVKTGVLREIGHFLVDIQGQNEHQALLDEERHIEFLDQFGKEKLVTLKNSYQDVYQNYLKVKKILKQSEKNEQAFVQRLDMLNFQKEEIEKAQLQVGEEEQLLEERQLLLNHQKITDALQQSYGLIQNDEFSSLANIGQAMHELENIKDLNETFKMLHEEVSSSYYQLEEAVRAIQAQLDTTELEESRIHFVEERLNEIRLLKRKYGDSEVEILRHLDQVTNELKESMFSGQKKEKLEQELAEIEKEVKACADALTAERKLQASQLEKAIVLQLKDLYLEKTVFEIAITSKPFGIDGQDDVVFNISTNPGEDPKALAKVASGGELSRVMLGMKGIFSKGQGMTSIIFDEVDTGVSGRVAQAIANKIHDIAINSQVLCITHLPQVAAKADHHLFIEKEVKKGRTQTNVYALNPEARINEIARMLAGETVTSLSKEHAKELLNLSK